MAEENSSAILSPEQDEKLRKFLVNETILKNARLQARIEHPVDEIYDLNINFEGKHLGVIRFKRWNHRLASTIWNLPFADKFFSKNKDPLTEQEEHQFGALQELIVSLSIEDEPRWRKILHESPQLVSYIYDIIARVSGMSDEFAKDAEDFFTGDEGFAYGYTWFYLMGKTPSEVAKLPETDVQAVNFWMSKWAQRLSKNVH